MLFSRAHLMEYWWSNFFLIKLEEKSLVLLGLNKQSSSTLILKSSRPKNFTLMKYVFGWDLLLEIPTAHLVQSKFSGFELNKDLTEIGLK